MMIKTTPYPCVESTIQLPYGKVAAKAWGNPNGLPTLGMHGWLDNAATFDLLAPLLKDIYLVSIDLPGHGLSSHKPVGHLFHVIDYVVDVLAVIDKLGWSRFAILGHSFGAAIGSLIAGTIPDRIIGLACLDALGPMTIEPPSGPGQLRLALSEAQKVSNKMPEYRDIAHAVRARTRAGFLQTHSAEILVNRGLKKTDNGTFTWRTDKRLLLPTCSQLTEVQAEAFLKEITAPTLLLRAEPGFPFKEEMIKRRLKACQTLEVIKLKGGHHIHLDDPKTTAKHLQPFFKRLTKIQKEKT